MECGKATSPLEVRLSIRKSIEGWLIFLRYTCSSKATIVKLAFSPSENLLAWTDDEGVFSRWPSPIPSSSAHPVKKPTAADKLFDDDVGAADDDEHVPIDDEDDIGMDADAKDWIDEDVPGHMDDIPERERGRGRDGFVKEMGTPNEYCICLLSSVICPNSEHHQIATRFPAWLYAHG